MSEERGVGGGGLFGLAGLTVQEQFSVGTGKAVKDLGTYSQPYVRPKDRHPRENKPNSINMGADPTPSVFIARLLVSAVPSIPHASCLMPHSVFAREAREAQ